MPRYKRVEYYLEQILAELIVARLERRKEAIIDEARQAQLDQFEHMMYLEHGHEDH